MLMTSTRTLLAASLSVAALGLGACAAEQANRAGPVTPLTQYSARAEAAVDRVALAAHADGLSDAQRQALRALAQRRADVDGGAITISLPHGPADAAATARTAAAAQAELGVAGAQVLRSSYESDDPKAPVLVSFDYDKAEIPQCGHWDDLTKTAENGGYANFGCAVTANMAAMVARPSDLMHPRAEEASDADRRVGVVGKYKAGKVTTQDEPPVHASISQIGQ
ncbi:MAG TPA: CpaD family pilus assembly lipoprotein [Caulobacteraceae bacterium]|jgi:pilus assembly protein CpaD